MTSDEIISFLRSERISRILRQKDLCIIPTHGEEALSPTMVSLYERKIVNPTLSKVCEWARMLGYEVSLVKVEAKS